MFASSRCDLGYLVPSVHSGPGAARQAAEAYTCWPVRCCAVAVCQDELVIRMLDEILLPGFEVEFIIENRPLARRLHEAGVTVTVGDPRRIDTYLKADIGPSTCVIIADNGKRSLKLLER